MVSFERELHEALISLNVIKAKIAFHFKLKEINIKKGRFSS